MSAPVLRRAAVVMMVALSACRETPSPHRQAVAGGESARGRELVVQYGCGGCHFIPGVPGAVGRVGPPLAGFADRSFIAGNLRNEPEMLVRWIQDPQGVEPRTVMPVLGVTEAHARDIAAYLYTLERDGLSPPHLFPSRVLERH